MTGAKVIRGLRQAVRAAKRGEPPRCVPTPSEAALHVAVAEFLAVALRPPVIWTTFPAGGGGKARGGQLRAKGLGRGWPDIQILSPRVGGGSNFLGIELKSAAGSLSDDQRDAREAILAAGGQVVVCRSIEEVHETLRVFRLPVFAEPWGKGFKRNEP